MPATDSACTQPPLPRAITPSSTAIQVKPPAHSADSTACVMWLSVSTLCQQKACATTMNIGTAQAAACTAGRPAWAAS